MKDKLTDIILAKVGAERLRQFAKWGRQRRTWPEWICILGEEFGEASTDANKIYWRELEGTIVNREKLEAFQLELVQTAAVAVAIAEHVQELLDSEEYGE